MVQPCSWTMLFPAWNFTLFAKPELCCELPLLQAR
jgi:hypothetical protein